MRLAIRLAPLAALLLALVIPTGVLADHCGGDATISPASGPPGTTFVFGSSLGASSTLYLYRNQRLVDEVALEGSDVFRYRIETAAGDTGSWRARAELIGRPDCAAEASFTVIGAPDTSTTNELPGSVPLVVAAAGLVAFVCAVRRTDRPSR